MRTQNENQHIFTRQTPNSRNTPIAADTSKLRVHVFTLARHPPHMTHQTWPQNENRHIFTPIARIRRKIQFHVFARTTHPTHATHTTNNAGGHKMKIGVSNDENRRAKKNMKRDIMAHFWVDKRKTISFTSFSLVSFPSSARAHGGRPPPPK